MTQVATRPKTRYARSTGGVSIAYQVVGDGPLDLVFIPGYVSNVDYYWEMPGTARALERLASFTRLIVWDKRGTGLSDPVGSVPTLDERSEDLRAVMDAAGSERAALFGISEGGPMGLMFAAAHPDRTVALILHGASPKFSAGPDWPWGWSRDEIVQRLDELERDWGEGALLDLFAPSRAADPAARQVWGRFQRTGASPAMGRAVYEALVELDCRDILPAVRVPTLIVHRTDERVARVEAARFMAEQIPGARLVELPGIDHAFTMGDWVPVVDEIEQFLTGVRHHRSFDRVLATIVFTDIVDSTARAAELSDHHWRNLLADHDAVVRRELDRFGGQEIKRTGDGFLALFTGPSRAIACACAIRDGMRTLGIDIRAGLHTGECEVTPDDVEGLAVHIAARVAAVGGPAEIVVSNTVRDLVAGSGVQFTDRGTHALKGLEGEWRLFTVAS
jgi:pimeloyl-ACP methyl ester carboxylesterase